MPTTRIEILSNDGRCTTEVATPEGDGKWPVVIVFFDAGGLRPAQTLIAERIAKLGYVVLQPDLFHRSPSLTDLLGGPVTLAAIGKMFGDPDTPDSPHTRASTIKSRVYLGPATGDLPAEAEAKLRAALDGGNVNYVIEHYDAPHGYAVTDASYNEAAAEKHYAALEMLFRETLQ